MRFIQFLFVLKIRKSFKGLVKYVFFFFLGNLFCIVLINLKTGFCIDNDFIVSKEVACQSALETDVKERRDVKRENLYSCPVPWRGLRRRIRRDQSSTRRSEWCVCSFIREKLVFVYFKNIVIAVNYGTRINFKFVKTQLNRNQNIEIVYIWDLKL